MNFEITELYKEDSRLRDEVEKYLYRILRA
jgi:hypothetical protein